MPTDAVAKLDFNLGKLTYLSDLEPTKVIAISVDDVESSDGPDDDSDSSD